MKIKIKEPLAIILKSGLTEFEINVVNGVYALTTEKPRFKQNLKKSEYEKIMAAAIVPRQDKSADHAVGRPKTTKEN